MSIKENTALIIIDMINSFDFSNGDVLAKHTKDIIKPVKELVSLSRDQNIPIIYVNDHYNLWKADYKAIYMKCKNEKSTEILESIYPETQDYFLIKPKHSAFFGTALNTLLHQLQVKHLILTGIAGNICVLFTANDAYMREFTLHIPEDCIASVSKQDNEYALEMMRNVLKAETGKASEIVNSK